MKALVKNVDGEVVVTLYTSVEAGYREAVFAAAMLCCRRKWTGDAEVWYDPRKDVVYINKRHEPEIIGNFEVLLEGSASIELLNGAGLSFEVEEG